MDIFRIFSMLVLGTELSFLFLVRSADTADRRCHRRTDGHNKGALGLLVVNTSKLISGLLYCWSFSIVVGITYYNRQSTFRLMHCTILVRATGYDPTVHL